MSTSESVRWSVVVPYYNEKDYLPATLASLVKQTLRPFRLILVDNASTDGSAALCRSLLAHSERITPIYVHEPRPGKTNALESGLAQVDTEFVAFCDADTFYPPNYLAQATEVFDAGLQDVVAVMATDLRAAPTQDKHARRRQHKTMLVSKLLGKQAHTGGFGQTFRTDVLRKAGGFSTQLWPFVLEDHEVMQRVFKFGRARHDFNLWCIPSQRRNDRTAVNWTLWERVLYHLTPFPLKGWFFYRYLSKRFAARKLGQLNLRDKTWA